MRGLALLALGLMPSLVSAQAVSTSPAPDGVAVTIYRDPHRSASVKPSLTWLNGFALITETRRIAIPAGDATIRFEGVAGGIIPQSAIVTGLPDGVSEKNQDALLLSPASLIDRSLGKQVHIRRTSGATGQVTETEAVIRSSADGAVVLQTPDGVEALRCTGLPETLIYDEVPEGLSAKPTLSVRTRSERATEASVELSYLATGFDWQANYVATLSPAGDRMELFAWLTLASTDETSFAQAQTSAVAGKLERRSYAPPKPQGRPLELKCWPSGTTSDIEDKNPPPPPPPPPSAPPAPVMARPDEQDIVVTGSALGRMQAEQEDLGDLKLYRIPEPVTVAAQSQKQVALLDQPNVAVRMIYRQYIFVPNPKSSEDVESILVTRNRKEEGLGIALPAGKILFFSDYDGRPMLVGESSVEDKAVGEDVEIIVSNPSGFRSEIVELPTDNTRFKDFEITVTNDRDRAVPFEAVFEQDYHSPVIPVTARLTSRKGEKVWLATVPANGRATFRYRIKKSD